MEALQLAQMLADLNDLQAAQDQTASRTLVTANKTLDRRTQSESILSTSKSAVDSSVAPPNGGGRRTADKFGRHLFTPPLSRTNSATPSSIPGTPRNEGPETDITRASTLLSLYEIRAKLKEQDSGSLQKAREKVNALAAKQSQMATTETGGTLHHSRKGSGRISYPK
ncbi:hypothetical protein SLS62_002800 [Diatrype stigma]|uniref:Uncharacterized protein n=1 Tax=Diatrype stigma TaxID=117547 RepID=A0AAN9V670_9PEZI